MNVQATPAPLTCDSLPRRPKGRLSVPLRPASTPAARELAQVAFNSEVLKRATALAEAEWAPQLEAARSTIGELQQQLERAQVERDAERAQVC